MTDMIAPLPIGKEAVKNAQKLLRKYKQGKAHLERRVIASENWWKLRNWQEIDPAKQDEPVSAWLWNCVTGKHADAMAAFPEPAILPRMADDKGEARKLTAIVPVILEQNDFQEVYSDCAWQKLLQGTAIYGVFWDAARLNGLGDVAIRKVDVLNLFWEPGITDIQKSRHVFHVELQDNESLVDRWPRLAGKLKSSGMLPSRYVYDDQVDVSDKSLVVDWYYRKKGKLHFVKFVGDEVLFATENDPENYPEGWYRDAHYPFVFDRLFPINGSPCGYSYIDIGKSAQESIDLLNRAVIKNAVMSATPRYFVRADGAVNEKEFGDFTKPFVHVNGNLGDDSLKQIRMAPLDGVNLAILNNKIEELKFTCGNTDVQAGGAVSGVTAASAIAALQEAAGRTSRDASQSAYRAYARLINLVIERIRQFYDWPRQFRILGEMGEESFVTYDNGGIRPLPTGHQFGGEEGLRLPVFDIQVSAQRESPYTKMSQNELAIQMMGLGVFNPQLSDQALMLLDMMDFKGRDELMQKISKNRGLMGQLRNYQQMALTLAKKYEPQMAQGMETAIQKGQPFAPPASGARLPQSDNQAGRIRQEPLNVARAREQAEETVING